LSVIFGLIFSPQRHREHGECSTSGRLPKSRQTRKSGLYCGVIISPPPLPCLLATCYLLLATCSLSTCYLPLATCHLLLATCYLLLATCYLSTCSLSTCYLPTLDFPRTRVYNAPWQVGLSPNHKGQRWRERQMADLRLEVSLCRPQICNLKSQIILLCS